MSKPTLGFARPPPAESSRRAVLLRIEYKSAVAPIRRYPESSLLHGFPRTQSWLRVQNRLGSGLCSYLIIDAVSERKADLAGHSALRASTGSIRAARIAGAAAAANATTAIAIRAAMYVPGSIAFTP
jgi:hypothetical protein